MNESKIQKKIIDYLDTKGFTFKVMSANKSGIPDIIALVDGKFYGIEVKTEIGRASKLQKLRLKQINDNGGTAIIARSVDDVRIALGELEPHKELTKACEYCGTEFIRTRVDKKYCSDNCKIYAFNKRNKEI